MSNYFAKYHTKFKSDLKKIQKRGLDINKMNKVITKLCNSKKLDPIYLDHNLRGIYKNSRECHIEPDWLLIYRIDDVNGVLHLLRTGTHSDLFR